MPKKLSEDWFHGKKRSLNVSTELGLENVGVDNLLYVAQLLNIVIDLSIGAEKILISYNEYKISIDL